MLSVPGNLNSSLAVANTHVTNAWGHTRSDLFGTKYVWAIDNFSYRKESVGIAVKSPVFTLSLPDKDVDLVIVVYPNGENGSSGYVSTYVQVLTKDITINAKAKLGIMNRYGTEKELYKSTISTSLTQYAKLGSPHFVVRSNLFDQNSECKIVSDRLTVYCEFSVVRDSVNVRCANFKASVIARSVSEDIKELFETQKFSDFALVVNGRNIKVHKIILAARSPLFAKQMPGSNVDKMEITDLSYDAVIEFLRYIYTGEVETIDNISQELLLASVKYEMDGLKPICYENIVAKMDIANGADLLKFTYENKLEELQEAALDFFKKHSKAIMKTAGFEILKRTYPQFVMTELFECLTI